MARLLACGIAATVPGRVAASDDLPEAARPARAADTRSLSVLVESPESEAVVGGSELRAFVTGKALTRPRSLGRFDVIVVIDTSRSPAAPSGADVDGDGHLGVEMGARRLPLVGRFLDLASDDPDDSILAAEVAAAKTLLAQLDPESTRVGVVAFSGDANPDTRDAFTAVPLTDRYDKVAHGLDRLLGEGPHGRTNLAAALETAAVELAGTAAALSEPRPGAERVVLFMTDGYPTLPIPRASHRNVALSVERAREAAEREIRIDTFAIGEDANEEGGAVLREIAAATEGRFTTVEHPRDLVAVFEHVELARIAQVEVRNLTADQPAQALHVDADGSFAALLPLREGENWIEVSVRATDGARARERLHVYAVPGDPAPLLEARLLRRRSRLLERELLRARSRRLEIEAERRERLRSALLEEMQPTEGGLPAARSIVVRPER